MEIDNIKKCWECEGKRISNSIHINREVSLKKLHSSFNKIRIWKFIRIVQWLIIIPLLFLWGIFPNMKNDGSGLFYIALVLFIFITICFGASYIYHYIYLSKIDFTESILKVQKKICESEAMDKKIYLFRFISLPLAFICTYKIFGAPTFGEEKIMMIALFGIIIIYTFIIRLRFLIPKEYIKIKRYMDEIDNEENKDNL